MDDPHSHASGRIGYDQRQDAAAMVSTHVLDSMRGACFRAAARSSARSDVA
jgi:hypothetical protein